MNYGLIEIGNITAKASPDAIRRLKSILDRHRIYHIVDGVAFFHPHVEMARLAAIQKGLVRKVDIAEDRLRKYKIHHSDHLKIRELIVPDLYQLNYMSLIFFDFEEAEFLATLIYEAFPED